MAPELWTPDRDIPIGTRGTEAMDPNEMKVIELMHTIAQNRGIKLVCVKCNTPFQGLNDGNARTQAIFCQCREIKSEVGGRIVRP